MRIIKLLFLVFISVISIYLILPNFSSIKGKKINLGLDLHGGASLIFQIDFKEYIRDKIYSLAEDIKNFSNQSNIEIEEITISENNVIKIIIKKNKEELKKMFSQSEEILVLQKNYGMEISYSPIYLARLNGKIIEDSINNIRKRIDSFGVKEASIYAQGNDKIAVELPGVEDPNDIKSLIGKTAKLTFHLIAEQNDIDKIVLHDNYGRKYPLQKKPAIGGELLNDASVSFSQVGKPAVHFRFNSTGSKKFEKITKQNIGKPFAIVLDNIVLTAPVIREPILGGQGEISGNFTMEEAKELAIVLKSGALPIKLTVIEERIIGPTLGMDSIKSAKKAAIIAMIAVCIFMIVSYYWYGVIASIALVLNLTFILAILTVIQVTLTLPGIAGLILTAGMAVDANVLIFERIREEFKKTQVLKNSIIRGFEYAKSTIFDANITTLIASLVMLTTASGPVKGFAVTLSIGIFSSMFTAITITRSLIEISILDNPLYQK
jgi:preprotein translocase subunit SecD